MQSPVRFISADWPAPPPVKTIITTRTGGQSAAPYNSFNLATHVQDRPEDVEANRQRLYQLLGREVFWPTQVHGTDIHRLSAHVRPEKRVDADAVITGGAGLVCAVQTADCLPVLLCDRAGTQVAAVHAGWRGLVDGIVEKAVKAFECSGSELFAYLGPAISKNYFEVGPEVVTAFKKAAEHRGWPDTWTDAVVWRHSPGDLSSQQQCGDKAWLDLYALATSALYSVGVRAVYGGGECTYGDKERFFSYRRDGRCGRMASLIWLEA